VQADINVGGVVEPEQIELVGRTLHKPLYFVQTREEMIAFSEDGRVQARYRLPDARPSQRWNPLSSVFLDTWTPRNTWQMVWYGWQPCVWPTSAPLVLLVAWNADQYVECEHLLSRYAHLLSTRSDAARKRFLLQSWYVLGPGLAMALLALLVCNRRLRKYPFSRGEKITWRLLMLLIGPGALLALYALYDWPAKEPCPACGKKRVVNRENCEFCGASFTPPAPTGKEIFEKDEV
jgi:hypothetical protein